MTDPFGQQATPQFTQTPDQWAQGSAQPEQPADTSGFFGGGASLSFADRVWYGKPRGGQVLSKRLGNQTVPGGQVKTWDDGTPRKQLIVTLQTNERVSAEDDGKRELYIKGGMVKAVREELQRNNMNDVQVGGWLYVAWVDEKDVGKGNKMKLFSAQYTPVGSPPPALASQPVQMVGGPPAPVAPAPQATSVAPVAAPAVPTPTPEQIAAFMAAQQASNPFG